MKGFTSKILQEAGGSGVINVGAKFSLKAVAQETSEILDSFGRQGTEVLANKVAALRKHSMN